MGLMFGRMNCDELRMEIEYQARKERLKKLKALADMNEDVSEKKTPAVSVRKNAKRLGCRQKER
jgi:hypothetical protein